MSRQRSTVPMLIINNNNNDVNTTKDANMNTTTTGSNHESGLTFLPSSSHRRSRHAAAAAALSKDETILLSSNGDVLSCRCRNSLYPHASEGWQGYSWGDELAVICCEADCDDLSTQLQDSAICTNWGGSRRPGKGAKSSSSSRGALLGGAPAQIAASPLHHHHESHHHHHHHHHSPHHPHYDDQPYLNNNVNGHSHLANNKSHIKHTPHQAGIRVSSLFREDTHRIHTTGQPEANHENNLTLANKAQKAFRSQPLRNTESSIDEESIVPIRSFDYSHFADGGNDMIPSEMLSQSALSSSNRNEINSQNDYNNDYLRKQQDSTPQFIHGVPTFLRSFLHVKVTQIAANPLGSHVLLISDAGILYSYGLNDFGQLGIGIRSHAAGPQRAFVMNPTIVTPILENGGKAIACSAGVNHSLVVVMTEERRLVKAASFDPTQPKPRNTESFAYHQIYGFGNNDSMKIGLVSPKLAYVGSSEDMECVTLPRRVALRCKIRPSSNNERSTSHNQGIFCIKASEQHSAALVRRASGDVELYTWGSAMSGALGLPSPVGTEMNATSTGSAGSSEKTHANRPRFVNVVPVPSFVSTLSRKSILEARASSMLINEEGEHPVDIALGRHCTFVLTSLGRCFSFGTSEDGMLGLGSRVTEVNEPAEIPFPKRGEFIRSISAGASHVLATTKEGTVYAWGEKFLAGFCSPERLEGVTDHAGNTIQWKPKRLDIESSSILNNNHLPAQNQNRNPQGGTGSDIVSVNSSNNHSSNNSKNPDEENSCKIETAFAGYDSSVFITESGRVLSSGRKSGRLGLGEIIDHVQTSRPMYGGLRLWKEHALEMVVTVNDPTALAIPSSPALPTGRRMAKKKAPVRSLTTL